MKKKRHNIPAGHWYTIWKQVCNLIPPHLVKRLAGEYGVDEQSRTFTPWSHVVALEYAQLTHAIGRNDVCDALSMNAEALATIRGATPPSRNNLSHANKIRDSRMAEGLYWAVMEHLMTVSPGFAKGKVRRGYLRRFRKVIHAMDSTTIFDKAYLDFEHLYELTTRGVFWVSRAKDNLQYRVVERLRTTDNPRVLRDEIIELSVFYSQQAYPQRLRRVVALVEVDGQDMELIFLTNHFTWSAWTVAELYRCRRDIEVFFKEIKQTLQLADFLGHSANAVRWQIWMGPLTHLLLRYLAYLHSWAHSFTRLFTVIRAVLWRRWHLGDLLDGYGTAKPPGRICGTPEQAHLPGFA